MQAYDVVVIGAGNGGMTASVALAQKGLNVLLLERHNVPGGAATTFCRGRFEFEVALHLLGLIGPPGKPGPLRDALENIGVLDDVELVDIVDIARVIVPGRMDIALKSDRSQVEDALQRQFPGEQAGIKRFFDFVYGFSDEYFRVHIFGDTDITRERYPLLVQYAFRSAQDVLDSFFSDPLLKATLSVNWPSVGLPPGYISCHWLAVILFSFLEFGLHHLKGGSQALSNAVVNRFLSYGGTARFNCGASKIVVEDGAVKGVVTEDGEQIETRYVVSNASTVATYRDLIGSEHVSAEVFKHMRRSALGPSAIILFAGLDCEPDEVGIKESMNYLMAHTDIASRSLSEMRQLDVGTDLLGFSCFDIADPGFSPEGTCQLNMVCLKYADPWLQVPPSEYTKVKYRCAEAMLNRLEEAFPGVRSHMEEVEVATPLTHMRYLGHPAGSIFGFNRDLKDGPFTPPASFTAASAIKGLFFAGAWIGDHGFPATYMSGPVAAEAIVNDLKG